jgi:hypothetical protein
LFVVLFTFLMVRPFHARRWVRTMNWDAAGGRVDIIVHEVIDGVQGMGSVFGMRELVRRLVETGYAGTTVRLRQAADPEEIAPIDAPFEPQILDETSFALDAVAPDAEAGTSIHPPVRFAPREGGAFAYVSRNVALGGGWLRFAPCILILLISLGEVATSRRIGPLTALYLVIALVFLFAPQQSGLFQHRQWFVLPGGLLRRRAKRGRTSWDLHVFDRRNSVLIVGRIQRTQWAAFVADPQACEYLSATAKEVDLLLRAWLSPLHPPPVERLTDLS